MAEPLTVCPGLRYHDAQAALSLLRDTFGFTEVVRYENEDGSIAHAELAYGNGMVMLGSVRDEPDTAYGRARAQLGPASLYVVVQDVDAHHDRSVASGAAVLAPPADQDYGSREYTVRDPEGNLWTFGTYVPQPPSG
ncbi:VOC family protein [Actinacidiphila acidipaludis]|nr:VOC family protein [Streptomyces acidipaludis]